MKKIGHIDGAESSPATWKTHSLGMLSPHELFIPNPGERENIDADLWQHVGWVNPDSDRGVVCGNRATAGENGRPAYIERAEPVPVFQDRSDGVHAGPTVVYNGGKTDPMNIRRSEFTQVVQTAEDAHRRLDEMLKTINVAVQRINDLKHFGQQPAPSEPPMTFYDHAFIAAYMAASESMNDNLAIKQAHTVAGILTRNRANQP